MTKAMKTVFEGYQPSDDVVVEANIDHIPNRGDSEWDHDFYAASLDLVGEITTHRGKYTGENRSYNVINVYGHRFDRLAEFMKDNGFEFHGMKQFCRTNEAPKLSLSWILDERK